MTLLFRDIAGACLSPNGSVICIGAFDGVHLGHRAVLKRVHERAATLSMMPVAVSFEPIPREYFAHPMPVPRLITSREKIELLRNAGIQRVGLLRFNAQLAAMPAQVFVEQVLVARLAMREIWVGEDFRFGYRREGDVSLLRTLGTRLNFDVGIVPRIDVAQGRVSSSVIRTLLADGNFKAATRLLGRPFTMSGHVVRGQQLGRKLGYPTANFRLGRRTAPLGGIFAVFVHGVGIQLWPGVASLGVRPTVNGTEPLLEAHLFDFDGDLYGKRIKVEFIEKLRDEEKFPDLDSLIRQMDCDAAQARQILNGCTTCTENSSVRKVHVTNGA